MTKTVNGAFEIYLRNSVNLDPEIVKDARNSRENLISKIHSLSENDFFKLWDDIDIEFGSFARKTRCRELDDIDIMIGISADGATYDSNNIWNNVSVYANMQNEIQAQCSPSRGILNSNSVLNLFKKRIENIRDYSRSVTIKNGEAVTLMLKSKDLSFDIVPCFQTEEENGRTYYLIPNGTGNWMKTDPRIDKNEVTMTNIKHEGKLLELIRLCKKWNKIKKIETMDSYLLETLLVNFGKENDKLNDYIDFRFLEALNFIIQKIAAPVYDLKQIQGNINNLSFESRKKIVERAKIDYAKGLEAIKEENISNQKKAITFWREIFGEEFPEYE